MARILLVEDNELNQDMLKRRLVRAGHEIFLAADGEAGVRLTSELMPDLVLMDLSLPGVDGLEATRRIKATPAVQQIPVIALTAHALSTDRARCMEAGCDDYDTKPVDLPRLLGKIDALLAGRGV